MINKTANSFILGRIYFFLFLSYSWYWLLTRLQLHDYSLYILKTTINLFALTAHIYPCYHQYFQVLWVNQTWVNYYETSLCTSVNFPTFKFLLVFCIIMHCKKDIQRKRIPMIALWCPAFSNQGQCTNRPNHPDHAIIIFKENMWAERIKKYSLTLPFYKTRVFFWKEELFRKPYYRYKIYASLPPGR